MEVIIISDGFSFPKGKKISVSDQRGKYLIENGIAKTASGESGKEPTIVEPPETVALSKPETDNEFPKHIGRGIYILSNGEKVTGKEDALKAEAELH